MGYVHITQDQMQREISSDCARLYVGTCTPTREERNTHAHVCPRQAQVCVCIDVSTSLGGSCVYLNIAIRNVCVGTDPGLREREREKET